MQINKTDINLSQKTANPFIKTTRNSKEMANPFKFSNFEGNTLQFADVFEGFEQKKPSFKGKMISSSVAGSMIKLHSNITESISNFVNRVKNGVSNIWEYAKNTNISDVKGFRTISSVLNTDVVDIGKGLSNSISNSISNIGKGMSDGMSKINDSVVGLGKGISERIPSINLKPINFGKGLSDKLSALVENIHSNNSLADKSVDELKTMWLCEISKSEVA